MREVVARLVGLPGRRTADEVGDGLRGEHGAWPSSGARIGVDRAVNRQFAFWGPLLVISLSHRSVLRCRAESGSMEDGPWIVAT